MTATIPASNLRVISAVAVLNSDGSVKDYLTDIMQGGTVTIDATAENLRTCQFECLDPAGLLTPVDPNSGQLQPNGQEIQVFCGYAVDGDITLFSQGIFRITECDVASGSVGTTDPGPVLTVSGTDRSLRISLNLFADSYSIAAGTAVQQAVLDILGQVAPWCTQISIAPSTATVAAQEFVPGDDGWQGIQKIVATAGQIAFFDREGVFRVINNPSSNPTQPTALYIDGPSNTATSVVRTNSNSPGYNGVIVTGQSLSSGSTAISGSAYDEDPNSPQYAGGPYGKVPAPPVQVDTATTAGACAAIAQSLLPQVLGMTRQTAVTCVPSYWIEAFDLIYVANAATQTTGVGILEQATIPMDFSQLEQLTTVPLGTPIGQFDGLSSTPSVGAYAPVSTGAINYNPTTGTYTYGSSGSSSTSPLGSGLGLTSIGGFGLGVFGFGGLGGLGTGGIISRVLRVGNGNYVIKRDSHGIETIVRDTTL